MALPTQHPLERLPCEVLHGICDYLQNDSQLRTLASLLICSKTLFDLTAPYLYKEVTLTRHNASSFFHGLDLEILEPRKKFAIPRTPPTEVDWSKILSRDLLNEWEELYGENPHLYKNQYLTWPDGDNEWRKDEGQKYGGAREDASEENSVKYTARLAANKVIWMLHSTSSSHRRKSHLLGITKVLIIAELPPVDLSYQLGALFVLKPDIFNTVTHLILRPTAVMALLNHAEFCLFELNLSLAHPFCSVLGDMAAEDICFQLPLFDQHAQMAYILSRMLLLTDRQDDAMEDESQYLEERLENDWQEDLAHVILRLYDMMRQERLDIEPQRNEKKPRLTIHNLGLAFWFSETPEDHKHDYRFFFGGYFGRYRFRAERSRMELILGYIRGNPISSAELIDANWYEGEPAHPSDGSLRGMDKFLNRFWVYSNDLLKPDPANKYISNDGKIVFKHSQDAKPCVCCGKKQLTEEESSIGYKYNQSIRITEEEATAPRSCD